MDNDTIPGQNRIMHEPPASGRIRDVLGAIGLAVLFVGVVYLAYGFGIGGI